jgi:shikimate kinase
MKLSTLFEGVQDKGIFKAIFIAGCPGAGKSTTIKQVTSGSINPKIVNIDHAIEFLVKKHNDDFSNILNYLDKSQITTKSALTSYLSGALPLIIDGTSNNPSKLLFRKGILESLGYDVGMIYINTSLETAMSRAEKRAADGGRIISPAFIKDTHNMLEKNKAYYKSHFSVFHEIDNNDGAVTDDIILASFKKITGFFNSEIKNPIGLENKEVLKTLGTIPAKKIKSKIEAWY